MSSRNLFFLTGLLVLLLVMYFVAQRTVSPPGIKEALLVPLGQPEWQRVDRLEIFLGSEPEKKLFLVKKKTGWEVLGSSPEENYPRPAKNSLIDNFLSDLSQLSGEERVSGKSFWERFLLTDEKALHVVGWRAEQEVFHLLVGKRGPYWDSTFVRLKDSEKVYLVPENLLARFEIWKEQPTTPSVDPWIDKEILVVNLPDLKKLSFVWKGKVLWRLEREKDRWWVEKEGRRREVNEVEKKLGEVFPLFAEKVLRPETFRKEIGRLELETKLATRESLSFGVSSQKGRYLAKKGPYVYELGSEVVEKLRKLF
ncbi:DUF4340 domain-containing protein [Thermosulfurimonas dismutans]|uniref:DUF4340 domain-containing protein n=1 Tax=Thermosulfurimonas dismutans TaxID=999894 RepID=A0A179D3Z2_9BACT|nr:DUF4340 domain-containing protein [Thermosulfurimonas dismutans]OAQ20192.1 hypothetical protein TDIS_1694 [Thermosulfurimonas dismutans]